MGVLQRFERRIEGMVGLAFARIFKGKVHPAEIAKALQREADEQRSVLGEGRVLAPNVFEVRLGRVDYDNLAEWSDQLAAELADMVREHIDAEGYQVFDEVTVRLELDEDLPTGVFEVGSHVADPARPSSRSAAAAPPAPPANGHPGLPPLPPLRGRIPTDTGVSRKHVDVVVEDGVAVAEDLGSTNGTYLDQQRVQGPLLVTPGTPIRIGQTAMELRT